MRSDAIGELKLKVLKVQQSAVRGHADVDGAVIDYPILTDTDGDACLFNGLLASTDYAPSATAVYCSQAKDGEYRKGMFYRSPARRLSDNNGGQGNFFSRDMANGVLAAMATCTTDYFEKAARDWLDYMDKNRPCKIKKPWGGGCLVRSPIWKFAPDENTSDVSPATWALMKRVWDYKGWPLHSEMKKWAGSDGDITKIEAQQNPLGYRVHLCVVSSYIKLLVHQSTAMAKEVGRIAWERQPDNLFYEYVARGEVTDDMIERLIALFPDMNTQWGHAWVWEKGSIADEIGNTCGWDFVFLGRLFLRDRDSL